MNTIHHETGLRLEKLSEAAFKALLAFFAFAAALLVYGYEIANFSLSIDEEVKRWYDSENWVTWVAQGRWGMGLLVYFLPEGLSSMPFLPTLLFAIGLAWSAVKFSAMITGDREGAIVFVGIFVTSPIFLHIGEFNTISWGMAAGLVATAFATQQLNLRGIKSTLIAGLCAGFSMAVYQALFLLYVTMALMLCIRHEWTAQKGPEGFFERNLPMLTNLLKSLTVSLVFYFVMNRLFQYLSGAHSDYLNNWTSLSTYVSAGGASLHAAFTQTSGLLSGKNPTFLGIGAGSLLLVWIGGLYLAKALFDCHIAIRRKLYILALSLGTLLSSIALILLSAGIIPIRALISFPLLYATLSAAAFTFGKTRQLSWALFGVALFSNTYIANSLFYSDHLVRQRDVVMATRLIDRIEEVGKGVFGEAIPVAFLGQWQHERSGPALRVEIFGDSFFEHDGGNPYRIAAYLRSLGCRGLAPLDFSQVVDELRGTKLGSSWPASDAVFLTKKAVIVKLGDLPPQQAGELQRE